MINTAAKRGGYDVHHAGKLGKELVHRRQVVKATYDFTVLTGAQATYSLLDEDGLVVVIPSGAIVTQVYIDEITNVTGGGATISLGLNSTTDLIGATAIASFSGIIAGTPVGTAGTMVKATADRTLTASIATADVTAGKLDVYVEFVFVV